MCIKDTLGRHYMPVQQNKICAISIFSVRLFFIFNLFFGSVVFAETTKLSVEDVGNEFVEAFRFRDMGRVKALFDERTLAERAAQTIFTKAEEIQAFTEGALSNGPGELVGNIFSGFEHLDIEWTYLRLMDGKPLIRKIDSAGGFDYFILNVERIDGQLKIVDFYMLSSGELISEAIGASGQLLLSPSSNFIQRLLGVKELDETVMELFLASGENARIGDFRAAYEALDALPEEIKKTRRIALSLTSYAALVDLATYESELQRLESYHGDDPSIQVMLLDYYFLQERYADSIDALNSVIGLVGEDAVLMSLMSTLQLNNLDGDLAEDSARKAIELEPENLEGYSALVMVLNGRQKYAAMIEVLQEIEQLLAFSYTVDDFVYEPVFSQFTRSPEYKNWLDQ